MLLLTKYLNSSAILIVSGIEFGMAKGKVMSSARYFVIFFSLYLFTGNLEKGIDTCVMAVTKSGKGVPFYKIVTLPVREHRAPYPISDSPMLSPAPG